MSTTADVNGTAAPKRAYRSPLREQQAARTRQRIVEAAAVEFSAHGFGGTTMSGIARSAEVSVESVHATGSKAWLLVEAFRSRYAGEGSWDSLLEVGSVQQVIAGTDPEEGLEAMLDFLVAGHERSARLMMELRTAAAVDPLIEQEWAELVRLKGEAFMVTAGWMTRVGVIEADASPEDLAGFAAAVNVLMSAETYVHMTDDWGFSVDQYRAWLARQTRMLRP